MAEPIESMGKEYIPTCTMKINGKNVGKYANRPMDGPGTVKVKRYVSVIFCPPFQRLKVRVAAALPAVPLLLQALPNTEELEATPVFEGFLHCRKNERMSPKKGTIFNRKYI